MNVILLGGAGFIGINLVLSLAQNRNNLITIVDSDESYFDPLKKLNLDNVKTVTSDLTVKTDYHKLLEGQNIVYHLISTTVPGNSNQHISEELTENVVLTSNLLQACVDNHIDKVVFLSSGGAVYGKHGDCPLPEDTPTYPISSYGVQKITIEKLLYLYNHMNGLDYRVIRLANPYGPYQRPNGKLGAITNFIYRALKGEKIEVYGDGSVIRDFIYIDDAIRAIVKISESDSEYRTYNLGSGLGITIKEVLQKIEEVLEIELHIEYKESREVDVPVNFLDMGRYEESFGPLNPISLVEGIKKTASFIKKTYDIDF